MDQGTGSEGSKEAGQNPNLLKHMPWGSDAPPGQEAGGNEEQWALADTAPRHRLRRNRQDRPGTVWRARKSWPAGVDGEVVRAVKVHNPAHGLGSAPLWKAPSTLPIPYRSHRGGSVDPPRKNCLPSIPNLSSTALAKQFAGRQPGANRLVPGGLGLELEEFIGVACKPCRPLPVSWDYRKKLPCGSFSLHRISVFRRPVQQLAQGLR